MTTGSSALATDGDWASAVDAAQAVDPAIVPPAIVTGDIRAVGGGDINGSGTTGNFALSGFRKDGVVRGQLTRSAPRARGFTPTSSASEQRR